MDNKASGNQLRGYTLIALAATFWALSGILAKYLFANRTVDPVILVEWRMLLGFFILLAALIVFAPGSLRIRLRDLPFFLIYGSFGMAMVQLTYFTAISEGNVSTAIFLQYLAPLITALYTVMWLREPPPAGLARNMALALAGSALLLLGGGGGLATSPLGVVAGLASAGFLSFYAIYGSRGVGMYSSHTVLLYALGVGAVSLWPLFAPWHVAQLGWVATDWMFALYMAVFGTLVPFSLFLAGLTYVSPVQATLTAMLEPVLATVGAWLLLGESLGILQLAGCGLIVLAIASLQISRAASARDTGSRA